VEPGGLVVPPDADKEWFKIGLRPGDVIRFANGSAVSGRLMIGDGLTILDVVRGGKPLVLHITIHAKTTREAKLTGFQFDELVALTARAPLSTPVTLNGKPSGVRISDILVSLHIRLEVGDIVRSIGSQPIRTDAELVTALQNLPVGATQILVDHVDRPLTITVTREAKLDFKTIEKLSANHYRIPKDLAVALGNDPLLVQRGASSVPVAKNGKLHGLKLFEVEKDSIAAALGLENDDVVVDLDGHSIDTMSDQFQTASDLGDATTITAHVERRGKKLDLVYTIVK
jgi:S1-C subfamily serine protease